MTIPHKLITMILLVVFTTMSIEAEEPNISDYQEEQEEYCPVAYQQSNQVALWSAYAVITVFVVSAVVFGIADSGDSYDSSHSQDGIGSLAQSCSKKSGSRSKRSRGAHAH